MAALPPPPLDNPLEQQDGRATPPWNQWLRQLWDGLREVSAMARLAGGQNVPHATYTQIAWDTEDRDTHDAFTTGSGAQFVAPFSGLYHVSCAVNIALSSTSGGALLIVRVNGSEVALLDVFTSGATSTFGPTLRGARDFRLNAGDTLVPFVYLDFAGAATRAIYNNAAYNYLTIYRVA